MLNALFHPVKISYDTNIKVHILLWKSHHIELWDDKRILQQRADVVFFFCKEKFTTRHELALLRVSTLMGLVMFGGMTSMFYTQMAGILSVSTE